MRDRRPFADALGSWCSPVRAWLAVGLVLCGGQIARAGDMAGGQSDAMVALVAKVLPTVVSVITHRSAPPSPDSGKEAAFPRLLEAEGSGFVVDPDGYIATNRHVVKGAYDISVTFANGRTLPAKVIFLSPAVDVAFLKIEVAGKLPAATFAPDSELRVGERVLAVGNPLGLGPSVSAGIISALHRNIKESPYDDFIQTDAAINHGNSGGPLFNEAGEVIGINTALYTAVKNGGSEGLGFAIPARDVAFTIDQLKRNKRVVVGVLGAQTQKVTPDMAEALGYPNFDGAIVADIVPGSTAAKAGLQTGDIIATLDGQPVTDSTVVERAAALSAGKVLTFGVWRDGTVLDLSAKIDMITSHGMLVANGNDAGPSFTVAADFGLTLSALNDDVRRGFRIAPTTRGLVVTGVMAGSAAREAGIEPGDVLVKAQKTNLSSVLGFDLLVSEQACHGLRRIILLMQATGGPRWVTLPLAPDPKRSCMPGAHVAAPGSTGAKMCQRPGAGALEAAGNERKPVHLDEAAVPAMADGGSGAKN